ncbi:MAG: signal peptidase II [Solirubrobacterales bacterium]|nr:signal peptidase II [Solirubrobacterales bacterium]
MRAWGRAGLVLAVVLLVDQITKALVRRDVKLGSSEDVFPFVDLVHVRNRGVAFGAFEDSTALVAVVIGVAMVALIAYFATHRDRPLVWLPTGLLAGGAVGNLIDRVREGFVTDFVKLPSWPAFNVADMAITVGVVALVLVVERSQPVAEEAVDDPAREHA